MVIMTILRGLLKVQVENRSQRIVLTIKLKGVSTTPVSIVESRMHEAILTAMNKIVIPRVEMAVRWITDWSRYGHNSEVQNPNRTDFLGNAGNTPLMSVSIRLDLNTNQDRNGETRNEEKFEDGEFPALRSSYDRRTQTHHSWHRITDRPNIFKYVKSNYFSWSSDSLDSKTTGSSLPSMSQWSDFYMKMVYH